tara:strand:+ start:5182 stop:7518 length:2337 start_codon:yes stop_codon:yes gene_type:complete
MLSSILLGLSAALLFSGGAYTARHALRTDQKPPWILLTGALCLLAAKLSVDLYANIATPSTTAAPGAEIGIFAISGLLVANVFYFVRGTGRDQSTPRNNTGKTAAVDNLRQSKRILTSVLDALPVSITIVDADGKYRFVNRFEAARWNYDPDTAIGQSAYEVLPRKVADNARSEDSGIFRTGNAIPFFEEKSGIDGADKTFLIGKIPLIGADSAVEAVCMIGLDVTERAQAMDALEKSIDGYRRTLELLPDAVYVTRNDHIVFVNRAACDLFRAKNDDAILGMRSIELFHPESQRKIESHREQLLSSDSTIVKQSHRYSRLDGTEFMGDGSASVISWEGKRSVIVAIRDITAQIEKNAEVEAARRNADLANSAKSDFLATMSHEIRTPLNAILGMANILQDSPLTAEQHQQVGTIVDSGELLLTLLNDILDISKIEAGGLEIENIDFDLPALLQSMSEIWSPRAKEKGLRYTQRSETLIAPVLNSDPTRIRQILFNLLSNALKFTSKGEISVLVTQKNLPRNHIETRFEISDSGEGIAPENLDKLFLKFSQADSSVTRRHGGTGLGLSISKELAHAMNGQIGVESVPGEGSTFWYTVACSAGDPDRVVLDENPLSLDCGTQALDVLVAEDNHVNQMVIRAMLEKAGHRIEIVENGYEAVEAASNHVYDVILMDIQMPKLDGLSAMRMIRKLDGPACQIPIIALTANAMKGSREEYMNQGMDDYISKPIAPAKLNAALRRHFGENVSATEDVIGPRHATKEPDSALTENLAGLFDEFEP